MSDKNKFQVHVDGEFQVLVDGENYRVTNTTRVRTQGDYLNFEHLELAGGLNIEEKQEDGTYLVLNILRWDGDEEDVCVESVGARVIDTLRYKDEDVGSYFKRIQEYYSCLEFARKALADINNAQAGNEGYFLETPGLEGGRIFCYRGFEVEILDDEDGQQCWFEFDGRKYGCGAFNPFPEEEVKAVIDVYLEEMPRA